VPTRRIPVALPTREGGAGRWLRDLRLSGFTLTVLFLVVAALVVLAPSLRTIVEQQNRIAELQRENAAAQQDVDRLQSEVDRWSDPAFLRAQARDRLLYAFPGDITYLVIDDLPSGVDATDGLPISTEIQSAEVDWTRAVLGSVFDAGLSDPTPDQLVAPEVGG
jgi:cell division protein FtsB